ncbi:MAG: transglutaminase-like domain-containing protein [Bacteroidota bacterium]
MNIQRATPVNELLAKLIFLLLPTAFVGYFLLLNANHYFSIQNSQAVQETLYLAMGMGSGALFYAFRFRFIPTFILLVIGLYSVYEGLDKVAIGEFDSFFLSLQFIVFAVLFTSGWLIGWGFIRLRYWSVFISVALLCSCILLIAKSNLDTVNNLLRAFVPALLYAVYIVFTAEQIYGYKDKSKKFWWFLTRRLALFALLSFLLLGSVVFMMRTEIKETVDNYGGAGNKGDNSMLKKNKEGSFDLKNYSQLRSSLGRSNDLLFCAHIDNFFPNSDIPNPLYLTAFYYTKFDTLTETFERDSTIPLNDLFEPDPSKLPLFFTKSDSSVIKNSLSEKLRKTVDIEVYSKNLSPKTYLAPNTGYFVQPIAIEKDFRAEFKTGFRAKSYVSELNSAYFVYNSPNKQIRKFQEQRFEVLRKVTGYEGQDAKFMQYYTHMPSDVKFKNISELAHKVTEKAKTPVDKVIAIRDYFMSKDENGDPLYKYTDNPGVPDIPSASKLMYFLFENHKGYCAYYAGATLFMLRSLGIPSRITVGFLTMDRSDKNKGWYWYYADQAHAWVQVYFPGYGWLDFDTTVGNSDAQESPSPDGTPPMQPPKAYLAADGIIQSVDTIKKIAVMQIRHIVFHDKEYTPEKPMDVPMDIHIAIVLRDSTEVAMGNIQKGDEATAVSYADAFKRMEVKGRENATALIKSFPVPEPIDEIYLKRKDINSPDEKPEIKKLEHIFSIKHAIWLTCITLTSLLLIVLLIPYSIYRYYLLRYQKASTDGNKAYWAYRTVTYFLHQSGLFRGSITPMQYAQQIIDPQMGTTFASFMNIYLKMKYAKQSLTNTEQVFISQFVQPFIITVQEKIRFKTRLIGFMNPIRAISFYVLPDEE